MFDKISDIINCYTFDLRRLAEVSGADYKKFWIGADLSGVDLRGQNLEDFDFTGAKLEDAIFDRSTKFPKAVKERLSRRRISLFANRLKRSGSQPEHSTEGAYKDASGATPREKGSSVSSRIAPHIPYLRRYSRALSGSQAAGDAYVAAVLEAIITNPDPFETDHDPRISLYKIFSSLWQSLDVSIRNDAPARAWEERTSNNLHLIAPLPRQAFLLIAVEGFTFGEAALILSVDEEQFSKLIDQASSDIGRQKSAEIMIIEDDPLIAMDIEQMVENLGHSVTGIARTRNEAVALFERHNSGMVIADIQLADDSSGIDAVNDILNKVSIPVIFITAYPERLLSGNRPEPTFLITKPFNPDILRALVSQALLFHR